MSPGLTRGIKKGLRTVAQVAAGGALTALVTAIAGGLDPNTKALVLGAWIAIVAFSQNWAEGAGRMPVLLPTPALIPMADETGAIVAPVAGTVEAISDELGTVTGTVEEVSGGVVGRVTGLLRDVVKRRDDEAGGSGMITLLIIGFAILVFAGFFAVCDLAFNDEDEPGDNHLLGRVELVSHEYDDGGDCEWDGDCGGYENGDRNTGYGSDYGGNRRDDRNRNRGAFSPGPFDRSPIDFSYSCISLDCSGRDKKQDERDSR